MWLFLVVSNRWRFDSSRCVGSHLVLRGFTQSAALVVSPSTAPVPVVLSMGTQTGWGREPGERRTRDPIACSAHGDFQCTATLVA